MDTKKLNKKEMKNWQDGDTFIMKINNVSEKYKEYRGKYLALIYKNAYPVRKNKKIFYAKYIDSYDKPQTIEEVKKCPTIRMGIKTKYEIKDLAKNVSQDLELDEYQYAYIYYCEIEIKNSDIKENFEYIGNIEIIKNEYEFLIDQSHVGQPFCFFEQAQEEILFCYFYYNLQQNKCFTEKGNKEFLDYQRESVQFIQQALKFVKENKELLRELYGDEDAEEDSLTYVGDGLDNIRKEE